MDVDNEVKDVEVDNEHQMLMNTTKEKIMEMEFVSLAKAKQFYKKYDRFKGFGVQLNNVYKNKEREP